MANTMEVPKRWQAILSRLNEKGEVGVDELTNRLGVSANTIRNDLNAMAAESLLIRVRGGAVAVDSNVQAGRAFASKVKVHEREKRLIAGYAAGLVQNGDAIVLDSSSSIYHLALALRDHQDLTVVTSGLETAKLLAQNLSNKVILASDLVSSDGCSLVGDLNPNLTRNFTAAKYFFSGTAFTIEQGMMETDVDEGALKTQMLTLGGQTIALVDHSKFHSAGAYRFARPNEIDALVTDEGIAPQALQNLERHAGFRLAVVGSESVKHIEPAKPRARKPLYRIGFANLTDEMIFAQQVRRSLERAAIRQFDNVELLMRDNRLSRQAALENADWFVANGVDLMIEYQIDAQAGNIIMDKFNQANIPVIAVDVPMPGATYFGADNFRAGYLAGEALGQWVNDKWSGRLDLLLKLEMPEVGPVASSRLLGQQVGMEATLGYLDDEQVISFDCPGLLDAAAGKLEQLLPTLPTDGRIGIIGINDEAVLGALTAFERAGRLKQVAAVGQNADRLGRAALRRPDYPFIATTRFGPETYGEELLHLALNILRGEAVPPAVYNQHVVITRENVNRYYPP